MRQLIGSFLLLMSVLVIVGAVVQNPVYWYVFDVLALVVTGASGLILVFSK